ncbi:hypothetical protein SARC_05460 [Sphaeroforma arctica JP610]|uniref:Phytanoyl-CoA dioxygenase n=1 Tax=Sphaeroforma arctica JP610 TaxID=667725 RepID=A0A0L0G233_9EUKA|nr:hypothetical protein SARC_05460 [Sphaeroforma arctica JP610]KNC82253.1 hypothetical protein SARC_05460 [Sphaeroforma arctica JP610]|eukprot:XP_014156155.1 hypothetical protein SARC_05460 [Sphaeroforma arctica JP610]
MAAGVVNAANQQMTINKIQSFIYDDVLVEYSKNEQIVDLVENLMAPNAGVRIIHSMLINKPPGLVDETGAVVGGRHPIHQDLFYFDLRPPEMIVATWTAMQDVNRDNGCLVVLPGSHKSLYNTSMGGLLAHEKPTWKYLNTAYYGVRDLPPDWRDQRVHVPMSAGDTILFHPLLLHGSGRNRSGGYRRAISTHYASAKCHTEPYEETTMAMWDDMLPAMIRRVQRNGILSAAIALTIGPIAYGCLFKAKFVELTPARLSAAACIGALCGLAAGSVKIKQNFCTRSLIRLSLYLGVHRGHHMLVRAPKEAGSS